MACMQPYPLFFTLHLASIWPSLVFVFHSHSLRLPLPQFQWCRLRQHDCGHRGLPGGLHPGRRSNHRGRSGERGRQGRELGGTAQGLPNYRVTLASPLSTYIVKFSLNKYLLHNNIFDRLRTPESPMCILAAFCMGSFDLKFPHNLVHIRGYLPLGRLVVKFYPWGEIQNRE